MQNKETMEVRDLRAGNWLWVNREILYDPQINATDFKVYCGLASWANHKNQKAPAGLNTLAKKLGIGKNTLIRSLKRLEENGAIAIDRKEGCRNIYSLLKIAKEAIATKEINTAPIIEKIKLSKTDEIKNRKAEFSKWFYKEINPQTEMQKGEGVAFIAYWTEKSPNGIKLRWQKQSVFDIKRRWGTWMRNKNDNFGRGKSLPPDKEIRKETKRRIDVAQEKREIELKRKRTPEEQASVDKTLAGMREKLINKVSINKN